MKMQVLVSNFKPLVRMDNMEGKEYQVVPMIMLVEGVHTGSGGSLYYPAEEIANTPAIWNHKPVVVYHPEANGQMISACTPEVLSNRKIGVIMNAKFEDGKLKAEAWLDPARIKEVDGRVGEAIANESMMELSTGLFTDNEMTEGEWNGEHYDAIARNYRPDHLAVLPDLKGACSIDDGAGLIRANADGTEETIKLSEAFVKDYFPRLQAAGIDTNKLYANEMSFDQTRSLIQSALFERNDMFWVVDVYSDFIIYEDGGDLLKLGYEEKDGSVTLGNDASPVVRVIEYRTANGDFVGNDNSDLIGKENEMDKKQMVDALISNEKTQWKEDDREFLMGQDEDKLAMFGPTANIDGDGDTATAADSTSTVDTSAVDATVTPTDKEPVTMEEFINDAPPEFRDVLRTMHTGHEQAKSKLVIEIMANKANTFTEAMLKDKDIVELQGIANLARTNTDEQTMLAPVVAMYGGQAPAAPSYEANVQEDGGLPLPVMSFTQN